MNSVSQRPWYREALVWLIITPPAAAVFAGIFTIYLAVTTHDGLVVDDYYQQGKAINQTLKRDEVARAQGLQGQVRLTPDAPLELRLRGNDMPPRLTLKLLHATRAAQDVELVLTRAQDGVYRAQLPALAPGRWHLQLEGGDWRLTGSTTLPQQTAVTLG